MFNLFVFFSLDRNKRYKMLKLSSEIVTERQTTIFRRTTIVTALADEDTLFQTHCCGHIVANTNVFPFARACNICCGHKFCVIFLILFRNILCPQQMFPSLRSPRNIVGSNVSTTMCPRLPGPLEWLQIGGGPVSIFRSH